MTITMDKALSEFATTMVATTNAGTGQHKRITEYPHE